MMRLNNTGNNTFIVIALILLISTISLVVYKDIRKQKKIKEDITIIDNLMDHTFSVYEYDPNYIPNKDNENVILTDNNKGAWVFKENIKIILDK